MPFSDQNDKSSPRLDQRRDIKALARYALDLSRIPKQVATQAPAWTGAYPSPPMSGSPLSQKAASDASDRTHLPAGYATTTPQDSYHGGSSQPSPTESLPSQGYPPTQDPYSRSYPPPSTGDRLTYGYQPPSDYNRPRPLSFPPPTLPNVPPGASSQSYMMAPGPPSAQSYPVSSRPPTMESQPFTSPKSQRKAKGHVASACVPCKRAHLRCDAQRPCSRCLSNGKEESCVDVQHKKRGRPRLRDDREARYDLSRPPPPHDVTMRRPLSIYPSGSSAVTGDSLAPRYLERASGADANFYRPRPTIVTQPPEPVAYLSLDMEFARASETFVDAVGGLGNRRSLQEAVVPSERDRVLSLKNDIVAEQKHKEPNYLPPILGRGDQVFQSLGFGAGDVARFQLPRQDYLTFVAADGQPRAHTIRIGLAKEGSFFFVVLLLAPPPRQFFPTISPQDRTAPQAFYTPSTSQAPYAQPPPGSAAHDLSRHRLSEGPLSVHSPAGRTSHMLPAQAAPAGASGPISYSAPPQRPDYSSPTTYTPPRSDLSPTSQTPARSSFQLPPIRAPPESGAPGAVEEQVWPKREERAGRVDIGGLIEKPEAPDRPH